MASNAFKNRVCIRSGLTVAEFFVQTYPLASVGTVRLKDISYLFSIVAIES
jgi:hypothetical protein